MTAETNRDAADIERRFECAPARRREGIEKESEVRQAAALSAAGTKCLLDVSTSLIFLSPLMRDRKHFAPPELALVYARVGYKHFTATQLSEERRSRSGFIGTVAQRSEMRSSSQVFQC